MAEPATVRDVARELGLAVRTVQADVRAGCGGIVRPGAPGRGNGALLDLDEYRRWRARRAGAPLSDDTERAWTLLCETALRTFQEHGGVTRQSRGRSAELLLALLARFAPVYLGRDVNEPPSQMRTLLRVLEESQTR